MRRKPKKFDQGSNVRAIARERVGTIRPSKAILPKTKRKAKYREDME